MPVHAALFLFLAAIVVSVFAFLSAAAWITVPAKERQARDRFALLKTLAELPGENAARVLDLFQKDDEARAARRERDERRSWTDSGVILVAIGFGLAGMLVVLGGHGSWSVGLIPSLLGCALIFIGLFRKSATKKGD
jgi:predicted cobalt transporter CbtA